MNAVRKPLPNTARQDLQDQLQAAEDARDVAPRGSPDRAYWIERVKELNYELYQSGWKYTAVSHDDREHYGPREEQLREDDYA